MSTTQTLDMSGDNSMHRREFDAPVDAQELTNRLASELCRLRERLVHHTSFDSWTINEADALDIAVWTLVALSQSDVAGQIVNRAAERIDTLTGEVDPLYVNLVGRLMSPYPSE